MFCPDEAAKASKRSMDYSQLPGEPTTRCPMRSAGNPMGKTMGNTTQPLGRYNSMAAEFEVVPQVRISWEHEQ